MVSDAAIFTSVGNEHSLYFPLESSIIKTIYYTKGTHIASPLNMHLGAIPASRAEIYLCKPSKKIRKINGR